MVDTLEENSYFKIVVKDAISDLKHNGSAFVFFQEQVDAVKSIMKDTNIQVHYDGTLFRLTLNKEENKSENQGL